MGPVGVGRPWFYFERLPDLLGPFALADEGEDLELAVGEVPGEIRGGSSLTGKIRHHQPGDFLAHAESAGGDGPHGMSQALRRLLLHDVAVGTSPKDTLGVDLLVMGGEHQDAHPGITGENLLEELQSVRVRQGQIEEHEVGIRSTDSLDAAGR